ncbi:MAG: hypothetical protein JKY65_34170 [Planctomycetes bacterium]|nr:hypothetical protein [Planctomycetota bacterium]
MRSLTFVLWICLLLGTPASATPGEEAPEAVRGVTISCQTWGREWGSAEMPGALDRTKKVGGNWVAIHPYARISKDGSLRYRNLDPLRPPGWIARPIAWAHERGLRILIKPHLAYWGSGFSWRGEIRFEDPTARARFHREYAAWILALAKVSRGADSYCVGTELEGTTSADAEWRSLIKAVRTTLPKVPLTYAANWDRYQDVGFWDALDVIGIQAYFPLVDHENVPTDAELSAGWKRILTGLRAYAKKSDRPIVFTELGYDSNPLAASKPWKGSRRPSEAGRELQRRCLRAALEAVEAEPSVVGLFLWKDFAGSARGEDFNVLRPELRPVIRKIWGASQDR